MAFTIQNMGQQGPVSYSASDPSGSNLNPFLANAGTGALGAIQTFAGFNGLNDIGSLPQYSISPEQQDAYNMAKSNANTGLSQDEKNNFRQGVGIQQNNALHAIQDVSGGQTSNYINGALNSQRLGAENQFAANDNQVRRENQKAFYNEAGNIQSQKNLATQAAISDYNNKQQAYGKAAQSGLGNLGNYFNALGTLLPLFA